MLDVSRLLTGKLELNSEMVDVGAALLLAIRAITPAAENKRIRIEKSFARDAARVYGDATRLQQVFWNLLSNSVKFTSEGGSIRIRLFSTEARVEVEVSDTGKGIGRDFLPRVFQSLSQEGGTSTRQHGGLGLGLSIVKQLVEMHGGTVRAESEGENRGSTFTVSLPARGRDKALSNSRATINESTEPPSPVKGAAIGGVRVLVVDDEPDVLKMIAITLRGAGASVSTATSAAQALDQLSKETFDVLISDIAMPSEDGHSLARRIRAGDGHSSRIPAIALTAYGGPLQQQLALSAGFDEYVKKPFTPQALIEAVAGVTRRTSEPETPASPAGS
jgi:CheY-like chemotaxis protein